MQIMSITFFILGFCFLTSKTAYWHKKAKLSSTFFWAINNLRTQQQKQTSDPNIIVISQVKLNIQPPILNGTGFYTFTGQHAFVFPWLCHFLCWNRLSHVQVVPIGKLKQVDDDMSQKITSNCYRDSPVTYTTCWVPYCVQYSQVAHILLCEITNNKQQPEHVKHGKIGHS